MRYSRNRTMSDPARNPAASEPSWVLRLWRSPWPWMAIVLVFFCVPLFSGLDHTDLENDEAIYAFAVETMLEDGDWLTPKSIPSKTSAFLEKPPLKFWLNALPIQFGWAPASASGMRVTDAVLASLAFLYVFGIGRRLRGPVCGLVAVFLMFIDQRLVFEHGLRGNNMESALLLAYAGGIYHFLAWRSVNPDMKRHVYAMALWFVLGFMTKFVAAIFLPAILAVAVMIRREDRARLYRDWPTFAGAAAVALALILPWFVYQYFARGPRLIEIMFSGHVVKRFTVYLDPAHLQPWHFYLTDLWRSLSPTAVRWLLMLGVTAVAWRTLRRRWVEGALVLVWFALPVAVISTGTSKVYHYLYPFLPALYLCSGYVVAYAAELAYRWLRAPVEYFDALRSRGMPGALRSGIAERSATALGVVAWFIALATAAFDRIRLAFPAGDLMIRNSSVWRPAAGGALILLAAAPASILRAALVAVLALLALPIEGFEQTVDRTSRLDRPLAALRECARPISDRLANEGRRGPAIWSDAALSYIPIYYFGDFGPWQRATEPSTASTLEWLLYRPARIIVLGQPQWETLQDELATGRRDLLARLAATTGPDPTVDQRLRDAVLGLVRHQDILLLLPGPLSACGTELVPLVSR
jgi:4-amino-4-deoxy-L-arabinose transferase-like glycosyltransferase